MRIVFMGTPDYVLPILGGLLEAGHQVPAVYTRPDQRAGRGKKLVEPPVKVFAEARAIPIYQPLSLGSRKVIQELGDIAPEAIVVAAYGRILPTSILGIPPLGVLNIHPSLLPRYRGPSPVIQTIVDGLATTGVTVMFLDEGMDTGPVLAQQKTDIEPRETAGQLRQRMFEMGAAILVDLLPNLESGVVEAVPQESSGVSLTRLYKKEDGEVDWGLPAIQIERMIRAFDPWPGCYTSWGEKTLKLISADIKTTEIAPLPGRIVNLEEEGKRVVCVATGKGLLQLRRVQLEGRRPQDIDEFCRGYPQFLGGVLTSRREEESHKTNEGERL